MARAAVFFKKQVRLDRLTFPQRQMFWIGNAALAEVKQRLKAAQGPDDGPAKPLTRRYAIKKSKYGKGNRRNLTFSGEMLRNLQIRTVSENLAVARNSTRRDREKARANQRIQEWLVLSPRNQKATVEATRRVFIEGTKRLVIEKALGGKQR